MGEFADPDDLVDAGRKIREMGYTKLDAMTPFPVHGIDEAIGIPHSKLGWIVICVAALPASRPRMLLIWYVGAIDYPLVIGGKPLFDFTFSIPIDLRADGSVLRVRERFSACWGLNGLPRLYHPSINYPQRASRHRRPVPAGDRGGRSEVRRAEDASSIMRSVGADDVEVVEG